MLSSGVPATARANHGAATTSTNVSASSLRHTNELHSGWAPGRSRPISSHFAATVTSAATSPASGQQRRRQHQRQQDAAGPVEQRGEHDRDHDGEPGAERDRHDPAGLHQGAGHLEPGGRRVGAAGVAASAAVRRSGAGGLPSHDSPACAVFRRGAAESTATSDALGTRRPGAAMPELPTNARLPIFTRSTRSQPPPSS